MARRPPHGTRHGHRPHRREALRTDGPGRPAVSRADAQGSGSSPGQEVVAPIAPPAVVVPPDVRPAPAGDGPEAATSSPARMPQAMPLVADSRPSDSPRPAAIPDHPDVGWDPGEGRGPRPTEPGRGTPDGPPAIAEGAPSRTSPSAEPSGLARGTGLRTLAPSDRSAGCTPAQLRRFIKSRAWVPMHELRRRFAIDSGEDDVTVLDVSARRIFVGLPEREGQMLGELLRSGEVGYELSLDPVSPIVIGVYPMRPVTRA